MHTVLVAGAGRIGLGIAQLLASNGFAVRLFDRDNTTKKYEKYLTKLSLLPKSRALPQQIWERMLQNISCIDTVRAASDVDVVFEAIQENVQEKCSLFQTLHDVCNAETIFTTATASLSVSALGTASGRADRFLGVQFFPPVPLIDLVELIPSGNTTLETLDKLKAVFQTMGRTFIVSRDTPGFTVNRQVIPTWNEAFYLMDEGVRADDIDAAMRLATEAPLGPLQLADYVGLDLVLSVMNALRTATYDEKYTPCPRLVKLVQAGRLGRKSGWGVYRYAEAT